MPSFQEKRQLQRLVIEQNNIISSDAPEDEQNQAKRNKAAALAKLGGEKEKGLTRCCGS